MILYLRRGYGDWLRLYDPSNDFATRWLCKRAAVREVILLERWENPIQRERWNVNLRFSLHDTP